LGELILPEFFVETDGDTAGAAASATESAHE
jgi:hypothetical protein